MNITESHRIEGILNQATGKFILFTIMKNGYSRTIPGKYRGFLLNDRFAGEIHNPLSGECICFYIEKLNSIAIVPQPNGTDMIEVRMYSE